MPLPLGWRHVLGQGSIRDVTEGEDDLKADLAKLLDQRVSVVGGEHDGLVVHHQGAMDTALHGQAADSFKLGIQELTQEYIGIHTYTCI